MRHFCRLVLIACLLLSALSSSAGDAQQPVLQRAALSDAQFEGPLRQYLNAITEQWLLTMPKRNPALLLMFAERDKQPLRNLLPWSGEFAGKYLTGAVQVLRLTHDPRLKEHLATFVSELTQLQDADGYLGPFPKGSRLTGKAPNCHQGGTWDAWGHYHIMLGLLLWHEESGDAKSLEVAQKIGDLLCSTFLNSGKRIVETGSAEMNHAAVHGLCLLYRKKNESKYIELARQIIGEFETKGAGDYVRVALAGKEFFQGPKPRWESLHPLMGLAELYWLTGDAGYRKAFEQIWWSIAKLDRHNNGGFSSGEQAQGNPYHRGAIETCCTIAWMAMSVEMLRLTGDSIVADELELSMLNSVYGYQSRDGKWCTYNTPMSGRRIPSMKDIAFQIRPGSEELNCCSANAPRGFGLLSEWALMRKGDALLVNWYGPGSMSTRVGDQKISLKQQTTYPQNGRVILEVLPERAVKFALMLRIPHWSASTSVKVNGAAVDGVAAGSYLTLDRTWQSGDSIELTLDMSIHHWSGERESAGKVSLYRGPILFALSRSVAAKIDFSPQWKKFGDIWAADAIGCTAEHRFDGTSITWNGKKFDDAGKAQVSVDGKDVAVVDQYDPKRETPFTWSHAGLTAGKHTIKLTLLNEKNENSKGRFINVSSFGLPSEDASTVELDARTLNAIVLEQATGNPWVALQVNDVSGRAVVLRDFASSGADGVEYWSWLKIQNAPAVPFSPRTPLRSGR